MPTPAPNESLHPEPVEGPESTAARVALWRALHVLADAPPAVFADLVGMQLLDPPEGWRDRGDMHLVGTAPFRASIVARARFVEDLVLDAAGRGVGQHVVLGAGLDSLAQRKPDLGSKLTIFEVDQPGPQAWKRRRLIELGYGVPDGLRLVPVDFEGEGRDAAWLPRLVEAGFDPAKPAIVSSMGVSMYLTREAIADMLRTCAALAPGSVFALSFLLPLDRADPQDRPGLEMAVKGAAAGGTPFLSFFLPEDMLAMARQAGFAKVEHVSAEALGDRYFANRPDALRPPRNTEELLVAYT
jgi:methyltransferase (TIGR00027 family)